MLNGKMCHKKVSPEERCPLIRGAPEERFCCISIICPMHIPLFSSRGDNMFYKVTIANTGLNIYNIK